MAVAAGPDIIEDGLVLYYDLDNNIKSWKGEPTTNIISSQSIAGMANITYTYVGLENGWKKYAISGTWSSGTYPWSCRISNSTFTGGTAYSARFLVKINSSARAKYATWPDTLGGVHYVNDPNMPASGTKTSTSLGYDSDGLEIIEAKNQGLIYSTGFANPTTTQPGYFHSRPLSDGTSFDSSTDFVWIKEVQTEEGSYCTPYVDGTRSTSQSILDISGQGQTITASSLTYSEGNTPTFNGTSDYIDCGTPSQIGSSLTGLTVSAWFKVGSKRTEIIAENGTNFQNDTFYLAQEDSNNLSFLVRNSSTHQRIYGETSYTVGTWYNFVGVWSSGSTILAYVNGEDTSQSLLNPSGNLSSLRDGNANLNIGRRPSGTFYTSADIRQLSIYDKGLTAAEVKQNYIATKSRYGL